MLKRWTRRRPFRSKERRDPPERRRASTSAVRDNRPPLHPSRRSWSFEEEEDDDPVPMIDTVPTAKSFRSDDSTVQFPTIKPGHSRYSVEDDDDEDELVEEEEEEEKEEEREPQPEPKHVVLKVSSEKEELDKDDKYLGGKQRIQLWSDDTDSMYAKWRSQSGDAASPVMQGGSARNLRAPMAPLSPRRIQREPSRNAPMRNSSPNVARRTSRGRSDMQETGGPPPRWEKSGGNKPRRQVTTVNSDGSKSSGMKSKSSNSRSKSSSAASSRKEQGSKSAKIPARDRNRRGRQNENDQQVGNTADSAARSKNGTSRGASGEISERTKKTKSSKYSKQIETNRSVSLKTSSKGSASAADQGSKRSGQRTSHRNVNDQSKSSSRRRKQSSEGTNKKVRVDSSNSRTSVVLEEGEGSENAGGQRSSKPKKSAQSAPAIFDNLTSFNDSEKQQGQPMSEQKSRYAPEASKPNRYASPEDRNPINDDLVEKRATYVENLAYEPIPVVRQEDPKDNYANKLIQREIMIMKSKDELPSAKERDPREVADPYEKHYNPHTGTAWNVDDTSSLTGSFPVNHIVYNGNDKAAYAAFLALQNNADPEEAIRQAVAAVRQHQALPTGLNHPVNNDDHVDAASMEAPDLEFRRVRSKVYFPPAMKEGDPLAADIPTDSPNRNNIRAQPIVSQPVEARDEIKKQIEPSFKPSSAFVPVNTPGGVVPTVDASAPALPVASQPLADGGEVVKAIDPSVKRSIFDICQPATCYLFDGFRAVRTTDKGACDEPFAFLDCKALEYETAEKAKLTAAAAVEITPQVHEVNAIKLDEATTAIEDKVKKEEASKLPYNPDSFAAVFPGSRYFNNTAALPMSVIAIPTTQSLVIDDDSYTRSILGLEKLPPEHPLRQATPPPPRVQKSKRHSHDGHHSKREHRPHKRSHSKEARRTRSKSEEITKRPRRKSTERVRFASPEPPRDRKTKKKGFFGKMFRKGR